MLSNSKKNKEIAEKEREGISRPLLDGRWAFLLLMLNLALAGTLPASDPKEEAREELYQKGHNLRNEMSEQAIESFVRLIDNTNVVDNTNLKAMHNIVDHLLRLDMETDAYQWYTRASERRFFNLSKNNLNDMNLLCLLFVIVL